MPPRVYEVARVIQMNMEISLVLAHFTLLLPTMYEEPMVSWKNPIYVAA